MLKILLKEFLLLLRRAHIYNKTQCFLVMEVKGKKNVEKILDKAFCCHHIRNVYMCVVQHVKVSENRDEH